MPTPARLPEPLLSLAQVGSVFSQLSGDAKYVPTAQALPAGKRSWRNGRAGFDGELEPFSKAHLSWMGCGTGVRVSGVPMCVLIARVRRKLQAVASQSELKPLIYFLK